MCHGFSNEPRMTASSRTERRRAKPAGAFSATMCTFTPREKAFCSAFVSLCVFCSAKEEVVVVDCPVQKEEEEEEEETPKAEAKLEEETVMLVTCALKAMVQSDI